MGGRFALLIGTGSIRDGSLPQLDTPPADVRDLAALLRDPYVAGFDPVIELVDASTQQVGREIAHILDRRHRDDLVVIYYSGHAVFDDEGKLHLAMLDTELDLLSPTSISAAFIGAEMDRSRSRRQLLVLDCHFGTGFAHGAKGEQLEPHLTPAILKNAGLTDAERLADAFHAEGRGRVVFAACQDWKRKSHPIVPGFRSSQPPPALLESPNSWFTYTLLQGLKGSADLDRDGRITIDELYRYAYAQLAQLTPTQLPTRRGEASTAVPIAYAQRRPSLPPPGRASRTPKLGSLISDRYQTLSVLGEGPLGVVFSARDERTGRPVSVRCLRPPASTDASTLEQFLREAQVASAIDHPNVVRIYELGFEGNSAFIVMEALDGESLGALLRRKTRLEVAEALEILLPAMSAVSAAHAQQVLHRDLNPENIFVNRNPSGAIASIKVLGFGLSTMLDDANGAASANGVIGSPHYLPPEQLIGKQNLDLRADVYGFGVIMYEVLTGERPFNADNHAAVLFKIGAGEAEAPSTLNPEIPAELEAIVLKAMAKERSHRFADVENLRFTLQDAARAHSWIGHEPVKAPLMRTSAPPRDVKIETPAVFERPLPNDVAPRSRTWALGVAFLIAAGGAAGWLVSGSLTEPEPEPPSSPTVSQPETHAVPGEPAQPDPSAAGAPAVLAPAPTFEVAPREPVPPAVTPGSPEAEKPAISSAESVATEGRKSRARAELDAQVHALAEATGVSLESMSVREVRRLRAYARAEARRARSEAREAAKADARGARQPAEPAAPREPADPTDATLQLKPLAEPARGLGDPQPSAAAASAGSSHSPRETAP